MIRQNPAAISRNTHSLKRHLQDYSGPLTSDHRGKPGRRCRNRGCALIDKTKESNHVAAHHGVSIHQPHGDALKNPAERTASLSAQPGSGASTAVTGCKV